MVKKVGEKKFAYAVGMFPNPKTKKASKTNFSTGSKPLHMKKSVKPRRLPKSLFEDD